MKVSNYTLARVLALLAVLLTAGPGRANNWPAWRGPEGTGLSSEKNLPTHWSATENVRWKVELPERGNSTPVIWGDRIFLTQPVQKRRSLMCLDRTNGKLLWQKGIDYTEPEESHEANPYCSASPVTDGERVMVWYGSAGLACYDLDGTELWRRDLGKQAHEWGYGSSPILHGDLCILYFGPGKGGFLAAFDKKTGKTVWQVDEPPIEKRERTDGFRGRDGGIVGAFCTPIVINVGGRDELIMSFPQQVRAYDPKTGKEWWRCDGLNELVYASPIAGDGLVVAMGGFSGNTIAVRPGGHGDVTRTHRLWQNIRTKTGIGSGVIHDGHIYILNSGGIAECIELKTGKQVWLERVKGAGPKSDSWSSMVLAGDKIYIVNQSGDCLVLRASPKFELIAANSLDNTLSNSSVAVSGGELFIRTHQHLWCIGAAKTAARN